MSKFIDISNHNDKIDYSKLITEGLKGVIIKATEGTTYQDGLTIQHYDNLKEKIPIGFYHYLTVTSSPVTQAQNFWNVIKDKNYQIHPVLDVEQSELGELAESYTKTFIEKFHEISGQDLIIYSYKSYIIEHFSEVFKREQLWWIAEYGVDKLSEISGCTVVAWQYTENCMDYPSIDGKVDCNILYDEENFYLGEIEIPFSDENVLLDDYDSILTLQKELNKQCYTDYNWNELDEDGLAGELTLSACPNLSIGAKGNITKWVQQRLGITVDGIFGEQTKQAVKDFQSRNILKADGIVGKNTWKKLIWL